MSIAKSVLIATALAPAMWVSAGDLNPPAGPIAPTQRTPIGANTTPGDAISQFKITQPGSYYLTGNIVGVVGKHGIEIASDGVTLDLMGFDLLGVVGSLDGVTDNSFNRRNIAVINGSVRNWGDKGVDLGFGGTARLADLRASGNVAEGISAGFNSVVTGCIANLNGGDGIAVGGGSISNCSATGNTGDGISVGIGCTVTNCTSNVNGNGIRISASGTVTNCTAHDNDGDGIISGQSSTITNCTASLNTLDGIRVSTDCIVRGNTCFLNGSPGDGAGIHATGSDNHLEGNNCTDSDRGIDVDAAGNFITRNTCSGNTSNYDVVAANNILVVLVVDAPAVLGNSGGVSPGSTDPNANYAY